MSENNIDLTNKLVLSHLNFESTIQPLIPYLESGICTSVIHKKISHCKYSILDNITNFLFNQKSFENVDWYCSSYSINLESKYSKNAQANFQTSYKDLYDKDNWPICVMKNNKDLLFDIPSVNTMCEYLQINNLNKYTFIPVSFCPPFKDNKKVSGHYTCLIIDNQENCVYFFDPNGWTSYFNDKFIDTEIYLRYLEKIFEKYFNDLSEYSGIKYNFVSAYQWNPRNLYLNKRFAGSQVDNGGNCVAFTILFFHYLFLTKSLPKIGLEKLSKLEDKYNIQLINDYSVGLNRFIEPLIEEYKKELYSKLYDELSSTIPSNLKTNEWKNILHIEITERINKMFNYNNNDDEDDKDDKDDNTEPDKSNKPDKSNNNIKSPKITNNSDNIDTMYFENYNPEKFESIYNKNKQLNIEKGIKVDIKIENKNIVNNINVNVNVKKNNLDDEFDFIEKEYLKFFA